LFDEGLARLVRFDTNLQVSHIIYSNEDALLNMIKHEHPDMILLSESSSLDTEQLLESISVNALLIGLCIFVVHLSSFTIDAYERSGAIGETQPIHRRTLPVRTGSDLIDILKENIR
jgi:hypothetical protein